LRLVCVWFGCRSRGFARMAGYVDGERPPRLRGGLFNIDLRRSFFDQNGQKAMNGPVCVPMVELLSAV
jgi:hypothetical protein